MPEGKSAQVSSAWQLQPSVGTWFLPQSRTTARSVVTKPAPTERPRRSATSWQDLMKYLSLPESRRARTLAMAAKMARQQLQKAMERSRHYRKVAKKAWTPTLDTLHEGLANKDDGTTFLTLFDQDIGWYVKQVPRPLLAMPPALPGATAGMPKKEDLPPPPPCRGGIAPCPPSEPPKQHAMRRQRPLKGNGTLLGATEHPWANGIQPQKSSYDRTEQGALSALTSWIVRMGLRCLQDDLSGSFKDSLRWADHLLACTV